MECYISSASWIELQLDIRALFMHAVHQKWRPMFLPSCLVSSSLKKPLKHVRQPL